MKDKIYIKIHKKRLLHISIIVLIFLIMLIGSEIIICLFPPNSYFQIGGIPCLLIMFSYHLREYRDWVDEKYPRQDKKKELNNNNNNIKNIYKEMWFNLKYILENNKVLVNRMEAIEYSYIIKGEQIDTET